MNRVPSAKDCRETVEGTAPRSKNHQHLLLDIHSVVDFGASTLSNFCADDLLAIQATKIQSKWNFMVEMRRAVDIMKCRGGLVENSSQTINLFPKPGSLGEARILNLSL